ncbi:hypothetical protein [Pseudomonas sp. MF7453]|uniref:hypothetical protein n=1 Tax=Pseudomonas sp. MF7453 TaxID=2797539 RepID=UPI001E4052CF|nr:hypothetical protein [Pseudomonas sp. MF7453]
MPTKPASKENNAAASPKKKPASTKKIKKAEAEATSAAVPSEVSAKKPLSKKTTTQPENSANPAVAQDLDSPYPIPSQVIPVLGAAYGVGYRHIKDGLTYIFERWTECRAGDTYRIWMNGIKMAEDVVTTANEADQRFFSVIPRTTLLHYFVDDVYGEVIRVGSGVASTSEPQLILILHTLPGGVGNQDGSYHRGLTFTLSDTTVDSVVAGRGVICTIHKWANMRVNDLPMFYWGEHRFELPPLRHDQVGSDLIFTIDEQFLNAAGNGHFVVQFYLYDEVLDISGPYHRWSKPIPVDVKLDTTLLDEPEIVEADPVTLILEAEELHGLPATGSVFIRRNHPDFVSGDFLIWKVEGVTVDGERVSYGFRLEVVLASYNDIAIPNAFIRSLIQSTLKICYVRERGMLASRSTIYAVAGVLYTLAQPDVVQAHGPFVEPDLPYITVAMPDYSPPGNAGDSLRVNIMGDNKDGSVEHDFSDRAAGTHPRFRDFLNSVYSRYEGLLRTRVFYGVTGPVNIRESERRYIQIGRPPRSLVAPLIQEADATNNINPDSIGSVATFEARAEFRAGDEVIIKFVGSVTGTTLSPYVLAVNSNPFIADIPKQLIEGNKNGTLTVSYVRRRFKVDELSEEAMYTIGRALGELFLPEVLEATTGPDELDPWKVAQTGATVRCRYDEPKDGDTVEVCWLGLAGGGIHFKIEDAHTGDAYVDVTVPVEAIGFSLHPLGRDICVSFKVVRNGFPTDSPILTLNLLTLSHVPGATIDSIGESAVLEIPKLNDLDQTRVRPWPYIAGGQRMYKRYKGTLNSGQPYYEETFVGREVSLADVNDGPASYTPVGRLRNLADWTPMEIEFGVTFNHSNNVGDIIWFETRHHMVQIESNVFPYPQIKYSTPPEGPEVIISPVTVENKCQVLVTYPDMNKGGTDMITLFLIDAQGTSIEIDTLPGLDGGTVTFNISNDRVGAAINTTIQFQYEVILGRGGRGSSEVQIVHVQSIPLASLPWAYINNIGHGGTINPATLNGDAVLRMAKWPYSQERHIAWLSLSAPSTTTLQLLTAHSVTAIEAANGFTNLRVPRSWLLSVPNNGTVTITPHVNFNKQDDKPQAVAFPQTQYRITHTTALVFNQATVYLNARTYLIPGSPNVLPAFGPGSQVQYMASGGTPPYRYSSSNGSVANVTNNSGLVTVRGNGYATITVSDSSVPMQSRSYAVQVSNVVQCYGLGADTFRNITNNANNQGLRMPSVDELRALLNAYGARWPMGNHYYWSSTFSHSFFFINHYYILHLPNGHTTTAEDKLLGPHYLGVGLR